jgi:RNA polymerase sigma factor (TIGR02999 family)
MDATEAFEARASGNPDAVSQLLPAVYDQLRNLAAGHLRRERPGHTLQPTDLVHEAYVRIVDRTRISWQGRTHFFAAAAREMRRVLIDSARAHRAKKRWGGVRRVTFSEAVTGTDPLSLDVLALHEALERLSQLSARQAEVVELRFFGGLAAREIGYVLGVSERTVKNDWRVARAWLLRELSRRAEIES